MSVATLEPYVDKRGLASHFGCSVRWIEARLTDGMPSTMIAGKRKFKVSIVDAWLRRAGYIQDDAA